MKDLSIQPVTMTVPQDSQPQKQAESSVSAPESVETETVRTLSDYAEEESRSLAEMIKDAQERVDASRSAMEKVAKSNNTRYGDAPLEAYARLARAKSVSEVNAASGYARRRMAQLKSALNTDSENAAKIKAAINQLQKMVNRSAKKKQDLAREKLEAQRKAHSEEAKRRSELELRRRKTQRMVRESGYLREARISDQLTSNLTATQIELRQQAQSLSAPVTSIVDTAVQQYTAAAAAPAPAAEISAQG